MKVTLKGKSGAFYGLRKIIAGLKEIADGSAVNTALEKFQGYIDARVKDGLEAHVKTGTALARAKVAREGQKGVDITLMKYTLWPGKSDPSKKGHRSGRLWKWTFRRGIPKFVLVYGTKLLKAEMAKRLGAGAGA